MELDGYRKEDAARRAENRPLNRENYENIWRDFVVELEKRGILEFVEINEL